MKVLKKICVFLLVGMITFTTVSLSYEKANQCEAVSIGVGVGATMVLALLLYGAYYCSNPDNQEELKQSLTDYKNMTVEGAKAQYEINKQLFNNFCDYAISHAGSNAAVRGADGSKYDIKDMKNQGFPDFEKWDNEMKKQSNKPSSGFGSVWDKMSFGLDLLDCLISFFDDDDSHSSGNGSYPQLYFTGDDGYINRETGDVNISLYGMSLNSYAISYSPVDNKLYHNDYMRIYSKNVGSQAADYRAYALLVDTKVKNYIYEEGNTNRQLFSTWVQAHIYVGASTSVLYPSTDYSHTQFENDKYVFYTGTATYMTATSSYSADSDYTHPYFISTNVPLFATRAEGLNYVETGDASSALNLPPTITVVPTSAPSQRPVTPVSIYCNSFSGKNVTVNDITNVNYYIANNWDTTTNKTENLTTVINNYYDNDTGEPDNDKDKEESTPTPRPTLTPTENETGGDTNTYNFFIEIENILSPIKVTVENIYNFFKIDTEQIGNAWQLDYVPSADFRQLVDAFDKMSAAFGDDVYVGTVVESSVNSSGNDSISVNSGIATSQQNTVHDTLLTDYPVISFKCPEILSPYLSTTDSSGNKVIILCDFEDYAIYFTRFRAFINIVLWIGLLFYLMREVKVNFVIH